MKKILHAIFASLLFSPVQESLFSLPRHNTEKNSPFKASLGGSGDGEENHHSDGGQLSEEEVVGREELLMRLQVEYALSVLLGEDQALPEPDRIRQHANLCTVLLTYADALADFFAEQRSDIAPEPAQVIPLARVEFRNGDIAVTGNALFIPNWSPPAFVLSNVKVTIGEDEIMSDARIVVPARIGSPSLSALFLAVEGIRRTATAFLLLAMLTLGISDNRDERGTVVWYTPDP